MRNLRSLVVLTLVAVGLLCGMAAAFPGADNDKDNDKTTLIRRIYELEIRVQVLERRLERLERRRSAVAVPRPQYKVPLKRLPPGTQEREFNGMKYWIMPLETAEENLKGKTRRLPETAPAPEGEKR